jgi:glycine/D-amino acid oxidase-like deaminating enzyme
MTRHPDRPLKEVLVVGDGIIGLSAALELGRRAASVSLAGARRPGIASEAAAGLLAPSIGSVRADALPFFLHSLALFPEFVAGLTDTGDDELLTRGLIELLDRNPQATAQARARLMSHEDVERMEPALGANHGAWYHPDDGAVHLPRLVAALRRANQRARSVTLLDSEVVSIDVTRGRPSARLGSGHVVEADDIVLAAGTWTPLIPGLPRTLPVRPLKGEIISLDRCPLTHPVLAGHVYLVPRGDAIVVGATSEDAGFDVERTSAVAHTLHRQAAEICPPLEAARVLEHWAGLRPATPDMLPIIGRDPDVPSLVYACGHGRNGILLAPATAAAVAALCFGEAAAQPLGVFAVDRWPAADNRQ